MFLLDTDILVDFLRKNASALTFLQTHSNEIMISKITEMELIAGCQNKLEQDNHLSQHDPQA